jgi:hypothetical protein
MVKFYFPVFFFVLLYFFVFSPEEALALAPVINSFSPSSGPPGTLVKLKGSNLNSTELFKVGNTTGLIISKSDTMLVGYVMPNSPAH